MGVFFIVGTNSLTTSDLICWSFQIASGMQYLASHKVVHGDLAARHIYICEDNVVKIGDFGLAQSLFKADEHLKKKEVCTNAIKLFLNAKMFYKNVPYILYKGTSIIQMAGS